MPKEDLIRRIIAMSTHNEVYIRSAFAEFFKQNVCIPKGANRHPYADVLHGWIEGEALLADSNINGIYTGRILEHCSLILDETNYRIKPSEPVYKYRYEMFYANTKMITVDYFTDDELNTDIYLKVEETEQIRQ